MHGLTSQEDQSHESVHAHDVLTVAEHDDGPDHVSNDVRQLQEESIVEQGVEVQRKVSKVAMSGSCKQASMKYPSWLRMLTVTS